MEIGGLNWFVDGSSDAWLSELDMAMSLLLTKALNIVTRAPHNQKIFSYFGGLQSLMGLMKAAVVQLKGVASLVVSNGNTPDLVTSQLGFLQTLLTGNIVSIVANLENLLLQWNQGSVSHQTPQAKNYEYA